MMGQVIELPLPPEAMPTALASEKSDKPKRRIKSPEHVRDQRFHILISEAERTKIEAKADELGVSVADVFRLAVLGLDGLRRDPKVQQWSEVLKPSEKAVNKMTQNLNQIAGRLNLDNVMNLPIDEAAAEGTLAAMLAEMRAVRDELGDQIVTLKSMI